MGEYFLGINLENYQYIKSSHFGGGLKRYEIIHSSAGAMDAFLMSITDPGIQRARPADLIVKNHAGIWAGKRVGFFGDYETYAQSGKVEYDEAVSSGEEISHKYSNKIMQCHKIYFFKRKNRILRLDGSFEFFDSIMEVAIKIKDGFVTPDYIYSHTDKEESEIEEKFSKLKAKSFEINGKNGAKRVVLNIDKKEYINPQLLMEIPTVAGVLRSHLSYRPQDDDRTDPTTMNLLGEMLFSDRDTEFENSGRWQGDRLVFTAEKSNSFPNTEEVTGSSEYKDITPYLISRSGQIDIEAKKRSLRFQEAGSYE
jgi:hypothetical protein